MKVTYPTKVFSGEAQIREAAARLRAGDLVVFPTETVYGLGAHALDISAVEKIFAAKGRPRTSPLIVHVASVAAAQELVTVWPDAAQKLATQFWPGPLTLVLPKRAVVPDLVTAGFATVAIRVPSHPVALELLREAGIPVAAPSANMFMRLSPTAREHVPFDGVLVLEGGDAEIGIESTVLSLVGPPRLLRPGAITRAKLEGVIGVIGKELAAAGESPGLHPHHYQPRTPLLWAGAELPSGQGGYVFITEERSAARSIRMPADPTQYASRLYRTLHDLDREGIEWIAVERLPPNEEWAAVQDRLNRAARY